MVAAGGMERRDLGHLSVRPRRPIPRPLQLWFLPHAANEIFHDASQSTRKRHLPRAIARGAFAKDRKKQDRKEKRRTTNGHEWTRMKTKKSASSILFICVHSFPYVVHSLCS